MAKILATTFGTGYSPVAPGTMGALFMLIIYYFMPPISTLTLGIIILIIFIIGVWVASIAEAELGHDASQINIDEVLGMLINLFLFEKTIFNLVGAFIFFRLFDILKPFPVNISQKLPRGWGVMLDDVLAGIYGNFALRIIILAKDLVF